MLVVDSNQYKYSGRGPLDAKALVKTYIELLKPETWLVEMDGVTKSCVYNGMITAVWGDSDNSKNGVYFLHDSNIKTSGAQKNLNVELESNWHRLGDIDALNGLSEQIAAIQRELETVKSEIDELQDSATEVVELFEQLPETGKSGKLYVVTEDATTYVWHNGKYLLVGDGADEADIQIIHGGSAK
jgi:hypothetical protein